jgi:hypothetical protein
VEATLRRSSPAPPTKAPEASLCYALPTGGLVASSELWAWAVAPAPPQTLRESVARLGPWRTQLMPQVRSRPALSCTPLPHSSAVVLTVSSGAMGKGPAGREELQKEVGELEECIRRVSG